MEKPKNKKKFFLISGPCVIETKSICLEIASELKKICTELNIDYFFKASFDKANRSSINSFRGPGIKNGLSILEELKNEVDIKVLTDIHETEQVKEVCNIVDAIQIPAFLCRQTDLITSVAKNIKNTNKIINIKKGQFLAPWDMKQVLNKIIESGLSIDSQVWLTERGSTFGYNNLVVDFRSIPKMQSYGCPVVFDATHSVQQPGMKGNVSGGQREYVAPLSRAAMAVGVDGLFMEVHINPNEALSDGPNMVPLHKVHSLLKQLLKIKNSVDEDYVTSDY